MAREANTTYRIMSAVKSKDTKPERLLARSMWAIGLRYRKQYRIVGKPDFVFIKPMIAVFCDGDFWHGNNWRIRGLNSIEEELSSYSEYWSLKIRRNLERDEKVNKALGKNGWLVIRFWESDIKKCPNVCAEQVEKAYLSRTKKSL